MKICNVCNIEYDSGNFCKKCGSALKEYGMVKTVLCPKCKTILQNYMSYCFQCGTKVGKYHFDCPEYLLVYRTEFRGLWTKIPHIGNGVYVGDLSINESDVPIEFYVVGSNEVRYSALSNCKIYQEPGNDHHIPFKVDVDNISVVKLVFDLKSMIFETR